MTADELESLIRRYWQAEAAHRSPSRKERLRVQSWDGDLYRIHDEVDAVLHNRETGDRFLLMAAESPDRPAEDWVVAWLGGMSIQDAVARGDRDIVSRLVEGGMRRHLANRIQEFIA